MKLSAFPLSILLVFICLNSVVLGQLNGNFTYTLHRETNPTQDQLDAYTKIKTAMDSALGYYNQYTTLTKHINVYYNTGVSTADASYNGTIRFGSNRSYMVVHTSMHEIAHTLGIGTTTEYRNLLKDNIFTGTRTTAKLREITNDPDTLLHGDQQHFWPFGLNYANEVKSKQDLINHCLIVNEMCKDMFREEFYKVCRLRSKADGRYMVVLNGNTLSLNRNYDSTSVVRMITLNEENVFRLEFGNKVLEIPNESRTAGAVVGLYGWNGGTHQRAVFEFESQNKSEARIRMAHSGYYLRADGDRIIQDVASASRESQYWEITDVEDITLNREPGKKSWPFRIELNDNRVTFCTSAADEKDALILITDLHGRIIRSEYVKTNHEYVLPEENLARGLYMITTQLSGKKLSRQFIKK